LIGNGVMQGDNNQSARVLSEKWIQLMRTPCDIAPFYGLYTWLNTDGCISAKAPASAFFAMGVGGQVVLHDAENQLVAVLRWIDPDYTTEIINRIYSTLGLSA